MDTTDLLNKDQVGIIPASGMENEALAAFVRDGVKKLADLLPYVKELKARFAALPRGKADIMGCRTWKEFCENVLGRTDSAVRKALAHDNEKTRKRPQVLRKALELLLTVVDDGDPRVRFSVGENGNVLISARNPKTDEESEVQLDVKAPGPDDFTLTFISEDGSEKTVRGSLVPLPYHTFDVTLNPYHIMDALKQIDGDPVVIWNGNFVRFSPNSHGELRFFYAPNVEWLFNKEHAKEEYRQEMEQWQKERKDLERQQQELTRSAHLLINQMPPDVPCQGHYCGKSAARVHIGLDLTLEQLRMVVDVLNAAPVTKPTSEPPTVETQNKPGQRQQNMQSMEKWLRAQLTLPEEKRPSSFKGNLERYEKELGRKLDDPAPVEVPEPVEVK